jgi:integrase
VEDGHILANPAAGTHLPQTEKAEMVFLSHAEFNAVLEEIPDRWKPLVEFLVAAGCRFGEASALKPSDVNRRTNRVSIVRAWKRTYTKGGYELGPPKTKRSRRNISVDKRVLDSLDYSGEWLFTNSGANPTRRGGPVRVSSFRANVWNPALERVGLKPRPRIHDLRHTHASWLIQAGKPLPVISRRLGHESIQVTVDVYGHLDVTDDAAAADVVGDILKLP